MNTTERDAIRKVLADKLAKFTEEIEKAGKEQEAALEAARLTCEKATAGDGIRNTVAELYVLAPQYVKRVATNMEEARRLAFDDWEQKRHTLTATIEALKSLSLMPLTENEMIAKVDMLQTRSEEALALLAAPKIQKRLGWSLLENPWDNLDDLPFGLTPDEESDDLPF